MMFPRGRFSYEREVTDMMRMITKRLIRNLIAFALVLVIILPDVYAVSAADGIFEGRRGSSDENTAEAFQGYTVEEEIEGPDAFGIVNVLEIVPDERMAYVGYTIGGCEPLGESTEEKAWIMDAMANNSAGSQYNSWQNPYYKNKFSALTTSTEIPAFIYEFGYYTGYFKKVAENQGYYSIGEIFTEGDKVTNVIMVSKFATNAESHASTYDYVWVESAKDSEGNYVQSDDVYTTRSELQEGKPIYLHNYKKTKYLNNEEFLTLVYPAEVKSGGITYKADGTHGAYSIAGDTSATGVYGDGTNLKAAELFKIASNSNGNKGVKIFVRTPSQLQLEENKDIIDNVDLIVMGINGDGTNDAAFNAYQLAYRDIKSDAGDSVKKYSMTNDLTFEQVLKIYNRVCNEDLAIVCSHLCYSDIPNQQECNIWKLMFMLYLINVDGQDQAGICGSGREFFKDFLNTKEYKDKARVIARAKTGVYSSDDFVDLKASDIIRIDETDGSFITDEKYNGGYYQKLDGGYGPDYAVWRFNTKTNGTKWPTSIKDDWLLGWSQASTENGSYVGNDFFPLMYYYGKEQYWDNPKAHGEYILKSGTGLNMNGGYGQYKNQMLFNNQYSLFTVGSGGGVSMMKSIIDDIKPKKITPKPSIIKTQVSKTAYMTMNIVNGDSVNKDIHGNKIMYVNQYEVNNANPEKNIPYIPFEFEVRTTHPISKMVLKLKVGASEETIATYAFSASSDDPLGDSPADKLNYTFSGGSGKLTKAPIDTTSDPPEMRNPAKPKNPITGVVVDDKVWKYTGTIKELIRDKFKDSRNVRVIFEVESSFKVNGGTPLKAVDEITVVKREFFALQ